MNHLTTIVCVMGLSGFLSSCATTYPGGLTEEEYNALPPSERAHLKIEQERLDAERTANAERSMANYERQQEFEAKSTNPAAPTIHLTEEETRNINALTN